MTAPPRVVVYSCLMGEAERVNDLPDLHHADVSFFLFTDRRRNPSEPWQEVVVKPPFPADPRLSQRQFKILGHPVLDHFNRWLYLDNSVSLVSSPSDLLERLESGPPASWSAFDHDHRATISDEFEANLNNQREVEWKLREQLLHYRSHYLEALDSKPLWNGIFLRENSQEVANFARVWFSHVLRYSARDQLSFAVASSISPIRVKRVQWAPGESINESSLHRWPVRNGESSHAKEVRSSGGAGLRDSVEEMLRLRVEHEKLLHRLDLASSRDYRRVSSKRLFQQLVKRLF